MVTPLSAARTTDFYSFYAHAFGSIARHASPIFSTAVVTAFMRTRLDPDSAWVTGGLRPPWVGSSAERSSWSSVCMKLQRTTGWGQAHVGHEVPSLNEVRSVRGGAVSLPALTIDVCHSGVDPTGASGVGGSLGPARHPEGADQRSWANLDLATNVRYRPRRLRCSGARRPAMCYPIPLSRRPDRANAADGCGGGVRVPRGRRVHARYPRFSVQRRRRRPGTPLPRPDCATPRPRDTTTERHPPIRFAALHRMSLLRPRPPCCSAHRCSSARPP